MKFEKFADNPIGYIKDVWWSIVDWFETDIFSSIKSAFEFFWGEVEDFTDSPISYISEKFGQLVGWFDTDIFQMLKTNFQIFWDEVKEFTDDPIGYVKEKWGALTSFFVDELFVDIKEGFLAFWGEVESFTESPISYIQGKWGAIVERFDTTVWTPLGNAAETALETVKGWFQSGWDDIVQIWESASRFFQEDIYNPIVAVFEPIASTIGGYADEAYSRLQRAFQFVDTNLINPITTAFNNVIGAIQSLIGWIGRIKWPTPPSWLGVGGGGGSLTSSTFSSRLVNSHLQNRGNGGNGGARATGGYITRPERSWIGENGNEFVIPVQRNKGNGRMYLQRAASMLGMTIVPQSERASYMSQSGGPNFGKVHAFNPGGHQNRPGGNTVTINFGEVNVRNDSDINKIADKVKKVIISEIDGEFPDDDGVVA